MKSDNYKNNAVGLNITHQNLGRQMTAATCLDILDTRDVHDLNKPFCHSIIDRIADTKTINNMAEASEILSNRVVRSERFRQLTLTPA